MATREDLVQGYCCGDIVFPALSSFSLSLLCIHYRKKRRLDSVSLSLLVCCKIRPPTMIGITSAECFSFLHQSIFLCVTIMASIGKLTMQSNLWHALVVHPGDTVTSLMAQPQCQCLSPVPEFDDGNKVLQWILRILQQNCK